MYFFNQNIFSHKKSDEVFCLKCGPDNTFEVLQTPKFTLKTTTGDNVVKINDKIVFIKKMEKMEDLSVTLHGTSYFINSNELYTLDGDLGKSSDVGVYIIEFMKNKKIHDDKLNIKKPDIKNITKMVCLPYLDPTQPFETFLVLKFLH